MIAALKEAPMKRLLAAVITTVIVVGASALLLTAPTQAGTNPCSKLPRVCRYTWNQVERCCVADPRFDCVDVCY